MNDFQQFIITIIIFFTFTEQRYDERDEISKSNFWKRPICKVPHTISGGPKSAVYSADKNGERRKVVLLKYD